MAPKNPGRLSPKVTGVSLDGTLRAHLPARTAVTKRCLASRIFRVFSRSFWTSLHSARHSSCPERRMIASFRVSTAACAGGVVRLQDDVLYLVSAPGRIRTRDRLLRRQLLCPAELRAPGNNCARRMSRDGYTKVAVSSPSHAHPAWEPAFCRDDSQLPEVT